MADIRINALATTAASTASDDFIAVDGSANGTRKLNAYSPTFGGNLTVSGTTGTIGSNSGFTWDLGSGGSFTALSTGRPTITAAVASGNNAGAALSLLPRGGGSRRTWNLETDTTEAGDCVLRQSTTEAGSTFTNALYFSAARNATLAGNLTVSGTGNSSVAGTLLVATTTNSSNGKLQLADHTTSAGGIGFGTDLSFYRVSGNTMAAKFQSGTKGLFIYADTGNAGIFDVADAGANHDAIYFNSTTKTAVIATNGTAALTLDSSQNATFAGKITANGAGSTFKGTATNDSAAAGYVGEYVSSRGTSVALTSNTNTNVTSISLTAGDWDVEGSILISPSGTLTLVVAGVSSTSATYETTEDGATYLQTTFGAGQSQQLSTGARRYSLSATTTIYLVGKGAFASGTTAANGVIRARRVR